MQQTLANFNRDSNFKKDLQIKVSISKFPNAASKESNTACACVLLKSCFRTASIDQNSYLLPRFCFTVIASFSQ